MGTDKMKTPKNILTLSLLCLLAGCASTPRQLETAQWLYDNGEYYAAFRVCKLKLKEAPGNEKALELLAKVYQQLDSKLAKPTRRTTGAPPLKGDRSNLETIDDRWLLDYKFKDHLTDSDKALKKELQDLDNIVIPEIIIEDSTLSELADYLEKMAGKHDPDKRNIKINFIGKEKDELPVNIHIEGISLGGLLLFLPKVYGIKITRNQNTIQLIKQEGTE
jgi:hypothetical protein